MKVSVSGEPPRLSPLEETHAKCDTPLPTSCHTGNVKVIGAGLAGCEAAWQLAKRGIEVTLYEMKPQCHSAAHHSDLFAELVCSNSLKANRIDSAAGLLKAEMRLLGSLSLSVADTCTVPAGGALAVDREKFSRGVTMAIEAQENIHVVTKKIEAIPDGFVIIATGPLTDGALAEDIEKRCQKRLSFYDAAAPIVSGESLDNSRIFAQSRYNKGDDGEVAPRRGEVASASEAEGEWVSPPTGICAKGDASLPSKGNTDGKDSGDYLNCPMTQKEYMAFYDALIHAKRAPLHDCDIGGKVAPRRGEVASVSEAEGERVSPLKGTRAKSDEPLPTLGYTNGKIEDITVYEGCMPIEVLASRGEDTMRFGPLKPVGLIDPRTGKRPYAVVQLRREDERGEMYNLVGFQTNLTFPEQKRVFSMITGLENAEFYRYGVMHRNFFLNSPRLLGADYALRDDPRIYFAGQMTGVEGYMESAGSGMIAGINLARRLKGESPMILPRETMLGALAGYVSSSSAKNFQPMGANMGILPPLENPPRHKKERAAEYARRSMDALKEIKARSARR